MRARISAVQTALAARTCQCLELGSRPVHDGRAPIRVARLSGAQVCGCPCRHRGVSSLAVIAEPPGPAGDGPAGRLVAQVAELENVSRLRVHGIAERAAPVAEEAEASNLT